MKLIKNVSPFISLIVLAVMAVVFWIEVLVGKAYYSNTEVIGSVLLVANFGLIFFNKNLGVIVGVVVLLLTSLGIIIFTSTIVQASFYIGVGGAKIGTPQLNWPVVGLMIVHIVVNRDVFKKLLLGNDKNRDPYIVLLNSKMIGTTKFEHADPSMGVVHGVLKLKGTSSGYHFIKNYCVEKNIKHTDDPDKKTISTNSRLIDLKVMNRAGVEIKGDASQITGMDGDGFEISIVGIPHPFYAEEFPHHVSNQ